MAAEWYRLNSGVLLLTVHVQPNARRTQVIGIHGDVLKIKVAAIAMDGEANKALRRFLAEKFQVPLKQVLLKQGEHTRRKLLTIHDSNQPPEILLAGID